MELTPKLKRDVEKEIEEASTFEEVVGVLKKYSDYELKGAHLGRAFEKMFIKEEGFSPVIYMEELEQYHHSFHTTNGGDWCRDGQNYLGTKYYIKRDKVKGRIFSVKTDGYRKLTKINQNIRKDILKTVRAQRCVILDVSTNIECDHKDGMKDDWRLNDISSQQLEDFQPLSKAANDAKRQHCKKCIENGERYDAKKLGYKESYIMGNESSKTCVGCYWYDPKKFNQKISESFNKES